MSEQNNGQWAIVELMGHKVVAGYITEETHYGAPLLRVDVPETKTYPKFTQYYGGSAIYCITPVSEDVATLTAESSKVNPVSVYVPDLITRETFEKTIESMKRRLPQPEPPED